MATNLVKVKLDQDLRMIEIPSPPRFDELVKIVAGAYGLAPPKTKKLAFTYKDADGDEVRIRSACLRWRSGGLAGESYCIPVGFIAQI